MVVSHTGLSQTAILHKHILRNKFVSMNSLQCREGKWFSKRSNSPGNRYPGSQAQCRADYTDGLPFSRIGENCFQKTFWKNNMMSFHVPFHKKLRKKIRRNASCSAAPLVQTAFPVS